jgi:tripeptidyl-peptidase-1
MTPIHKRHTNARKNSYFRNHKPPYLNYTDFGTFYESEDVVRNDGVYNRLGRGIPDVSAVGDNILVVSNGLESIVFGTSASTPIFGAIVNRVCSPRL